MEPEITTPAGINTGHRPSLPFACACSAQEAQKFKVWTKTYRTSPTNLKSSVLLLNINKGDTQQKVLIVQVRCAAPELESSRRRGKCLHLQMRVSLCGCECKHAHLEGKSFKKITEYPPPFFTRKRDAKIFELIILCESLLQLKVIPAFPEKLSVQYM